MQGVPSAAGVPGDEQRGRVRSLTGHNEALPDLVHEQFGTPQRQAAAAAAEEQGHDLLLAAAGY